MTHTIRGGIAAGLASARHLGLAVGALAACGPSGSGDDDDTDAAAIDARPIDATPIDSPMRRRPRT